MNEVRNMMYHRINPDARAPFRMSGPMHAMPSTSTMPPMFLSAQRRATTVRPSCMMPPRTKAEELALALQRPWLKFNMSRTSKETQNDFVPEIYVVGDIVPSFAEFSNMLSAELEHILKKRPSPTPIIKINKPKEKEPIQPQFSDEGQLPSTSNQPQPASNPLKETEGFKITIDLTTRKSATCRFRRKVREVPSILLNSRKRFKGLNKQLRLLYRRSKIKDCFVFMHKISDKDLAEIESRATPSSVPTKSSDSQPNTAQVTETTNELKSIVQNSDSKSSMEDSVTPSPMDIGDNLPLSSQVHQKTILPGTDIENSSQVPSENSKPKSPSGTECQETNTIPSTSKDISNRKDENPSDQESAAKCSEGGNGVTQQQPGESLDTNSNSLSSQQPTTLTKIVLPEVDIQKKSNDKEISTLASHDVEIKKISTDKDRVLHSVEITSTSLNNQIDNDNQTSFLKKANNSTALSQEVEIRRKSKDEEQVSRVMKDDQKSIDNRSQKPHSSSALSKEVEIRRKSKDDKPSSVTTNQTKDNQVSHKNVKHSCALSQEVEIRRRSKDGESSSKAPTLVDDRSSSQIKSKHLSSTTSDEEKNIRKSRDEESPELTNQLNDRTSSLKRSPKRSALSEEVEVGRSTNDEESSSETIPVNSSNEDSPSKTSPFATKYFKMRRKSKDHKTSESAFKTKDTSSHVRPNERDSPKLSDKSLEVGSSERRKSKDKSPPGSRSHRKRSDEKSPRSDDHGFDQNKSQSKSSRLSPNESCSSGQPSKSHVSSKSEERSRPTKVRRTSSEKHSSNSNSPNSSPKSNEESFQYKDKSNNRDNMTEKRRRKRKRHSTNESESVPRDPSQDSTKSSDDRNNLICNTSSPGSPKELPNGRLSSIDLNLPSISHSSTPDTNFPGGDSVEEPRSKKFRASAFSYTLEKHLARKIKHEGMVKEELDLGSLSFESYTCYGKCDSKFSSHDAWAKHFHDCKNKVP